MVARYVIASLEDVDDMKRDWSRLIYLSRWVFHLEKRWVKNNIKFLAKLEEKDPKVGETIRGKEFPENEH